MTHLNDVELGRRLKALRAEPPDTGFEARLAEQLLALETAAPEVGTARVIRGPWLRRGPVRLIGATALLLAGAAAAMEGGVVDWVQARVFTPAVPVTPAAAPAELTRVERRNPSQRPEREPAPAPERAPLATELTELTEVAPLPSVPLAPLPTERMAPSESGVARVLGPRVRTPGVERERPAERAERAGRAALALERSADEPIRVPRVAIERRGNERLSFGERRAERRALQLEPRDAERGLERLRDVARQRRERAAGERAGNERAPTLERLRERRERAAGERRDGPREHERRERGGR